MGQNEPAGIGTNVVRDSVVGRNESTGRVETTHDVAALSLSATSRCPITGIDCGCDENGDGACVILPTPEQRRCHHRVTWAGAWPPPDETLVVCEKCHVTLLWAKGFLSIRDEYGEF